MSTYVLCSRVTYAHLCTISLLLFVYIAPSKVSIPGGCQPLPGDGGDHGGDQLQDEGAHQEAAKGTEGAGGEEGGGGGTLDQHFSFQHHLNHQLCPGGGQLCDDGGEGDQCEAAKRRR